VPAGRPPRTHDHETWRGLQRRNTLPGVGVFTTDRRACRFGLPPQPQQALGCRPDYNPAVQSELTPSASPATVSESAETYVRALTAHGVEYLFINPGTDTLPIQEALSRLAQQGERVPQTVLCLFELVALAAAHGYYAATGRPQAVLVHVDVGTQNLGGMVHNAQRGRAAVLIAAGRSPYTTDPQQRGTRDTHIHWLQEQFDQHGIVRNYVKWEYELRRSDQMEEAIARALQIATSDPPGPVYLTLPREVLMAPAVGGLRLTPAQAPPVRFGAGDPDALREAALRLARSERPLVLTCTTGRTRAGFEGLVRLADLLALPVVERPDRTNFPMTHELHQGFDPSPLLPTADTVLVLDADVPYIPTQVQPAPEAIVIQVDLDPVKERIPLWSFPLTHAIRADTARALAWMADAAEAALTADDRARIARRRAALTARHDEQRAGWRADAERRQHARPIAPEWLGACIGRLHQEHPDCLLVDESLTSSRVLWRGLDVERTGTMFGSGGSGLGWSLGAAIGVKLAHPDRPVVVLVGDGSFIFGEPIAALTAARAAGAPILVVVFNNGCYNATREPLRQLYPDGSSVRGDRYVAVDLTPTPRYDLIGPVVGAAGERVEDPHDLLPALRRGLDCVRGGQSMILDVILAHP
jgi:acetolactate synthase I/II/III large subunit